MTFRHGVLDALCMPGLALFCANIGIGVLAHSLNVSFGYSVLTTILGFSLSGQAVIITGAVSGTAQGGRAWGVGDSRSRFDACSTGMELLATYHRRPSKKYYARPEGPSDSLSR